MKVCRNREAHEQVVARQSILSFMWQLFMDFYLEKWLIWWGGRNLGNILLLVNTWTIIFKLLTVFFLFRSLQIFALYSKIGAKTTSYSLFLNPFFSFLNSISKRLQCNQNPFFMLISTFLHPVTRRKWT